MNDDLPITWIDTRDDITPQADGTLLRERKYVFRLGKFGPFTERVALLNFDATEIGRRVDTLRGQLRAQMLL